MGWPWAPSTPPSSDPLRDLDPSLRDFLSKESPVKYTPAAAPPPPPESPPTQPSTSPPPSLPPAAPPESLYPDGRYAHLWATYRPLAAIEAATKSDQEKLQDILDGYKERKAAIGRAAVENCVLEQMAVNDCYEVGRWKDRLTMCRAESRAFERCYTMQSRFLKALGYLSNPSAPDAHHEAIQMHADTLYHRMLAQEDAAASAKAAGQPEPHFAPILPSTAPVPKADTPPAAAAAATPKDDLPPLTPETQSLLTPASQAALRERLKKMTATERELEERGVLMEARAAGETGKQVTEIIKGRKKRREEGNATTGDIISGWFGW